MKIFRNSIEICDLVIDEKTTVTKRLMSENSLTLKVSSCEPLDIQIGDYTTVRGERYELYDLPQFDFSNEVYGYDAILLGNIHRLGYWIIEGSANDNYFYFGTLADQLNFVLRVILTKEKGWTITIDATDVDASPRNVEYSSLSCLSALHKIAEEFDVEFDVVRKNIVVAKKIENVTPMEFAVGKGQGLYKITRGKVGNQNITTRMYGLGGKTNMLNDRRLTFDNPDVPDNPDDPEASKSYIERNVDIYGLREDKVVFEDIFPRRNSKITSNAVQVEQGKANWKVQDSTMDFDLNEQILEDARIVFTSGDCTGIACEIMAYDHATKTITFKEYADQNQTPPYVLPRPDRYPKAGDQYHYINIVMPDSYQKNAQAELMAATVEQMSKVSFPQSPYTIDVDPRYIKLKGYEPSNGDLVRITNDEIGLDAMIRVVGFTFPVIDPDDVELTVNDKILITSSASLLREVKKQISEAVGDRFHPLCGKEDTHLNASYLKIFSRLFSSDFQPNLAGASLTKDEFGKWTFEVDRVLARVAIETPELIRNRITITNNQTWFADNGQIESVEAVVGRPLERIITIAKDKAGASTFKLDDLLRGIYVDDETGTFETVYMTVIQEIQAYQLRVTIDMNGADPREGLYVVRTGNRIDRARQNSIYINAALPAMFYYVNVDRHAISTDNIAQATGNLQGYNFGILTDNKPITERFSNVIRGSNYQSGKFLNVSGSGIEYPIPVDRGVWAADQKYYHYDRVSHAGAMWDCAVVSTTVAPGVNTDWTKRVDRGADGASGKDAPVLQTQFSINGTSAWHNTYQTGDRYRRESNDNGTSWSAAMPMMGEKGEIGADGKKTPYTDFSYAYGIVQPTAWSDTPPAKVEKQHLWERIQKYSPKADNSGWDLVSTSYAIINEYIQVGGVNLLNNSERISAINGFGEISTPRLVTLESGVTYCLSVEENNLVPNAGGWPKLFLWDANWGDVLPVIVIDWDMAKKHHLFATPQSGTYRFVIYNHDNVAATGLYLKKVKLESGTIPTAWSESPEDTQSKIDEANKKTYLTYHANTTTPPIPTGNGTTGGWHYKCEAGDLWVSVKKTLTIDAGTWSAPMALDSLPTDLVDKYGINAEVVRAQAVTSKFGTAINGGLVMTSQLLLRDLDGVEKAGMNGIPGDNYTNPSFWSGGSYAESLAGTAPICFRHNGVAKIGDLFYDPSGKVTLQKFGRPLILLTKGAVTPLGDIMAGSASGSATNSYSAFTANQTVSLPKTLTVTKQNSTLTVQSSITATAMVGSSQGFASSTLTVSLHRDGVKIAQLGYVEAQAPSVSVIDQQLPQSITNTATINMTITAEVGTYTIVCQAANNAFGGGLGQVATARCEIWSSEMKFDFVAKTERTELGSNGISTVFDSNNLEHTSWGADGKLGKVFKGRGTYDVPGVLFGYDVALTGGMNRRWGAYKEPSIGATKGGTGIYNVPHKVGHDQFTVTATAKYDGTYTVAHLVSWTATNIIVRITTLPGVLRDCGFTIIAIGNNQIE